jgi:hypothetical protein
MRVKALTLAAALVAGAHAAEPRRAPALEKPDPTRNAPLAILGRRSPELESLFAPVGAPDGMYDVYESAHPVERIAKALRARDGDVRPGSWEPQRMGVGDAFGAEGSYNRVRMALLVGGGRLTVVRGSLRAEDGAITAFTLISPYPDPELHELRSGTMTIVFRVPRASR